MPITGKDRFDNEVVFISLDSITGCILNLTASFPDLKIQNYSRKKVQEDYTDEADFENYLVCKKWKQQSRMRGADKDQFIREHVQSVSQFNFKQSMRQ